MFKSYSALVILSLAALQACGSGNTEGEKKSADQKPAGYAEELYACSSQKPDRSSGRKTPLHYAVEAQDTPLVLTLLGNKANPNAFDSDGMTPLDIAISKQNLRIAEILLENGANPDGVAEEDSFPLAWAYSGLYSARNTDFLELLLKYKARVNRRDLKGNTVLMSAVAGRNETVTKLLLDHGADLTMTSCRGNSVLTSLVASNSDWNLKLVQRYLDAGGKVNVVDDYGKNPLHRAAEYLQPDFIVMFSRLGVSQSLRDKESKTPIQHFLESLKDCNDCNKPEMLSAFREMTIAGAELRNSWDNRFIDEVDAVVLNRGSYTLLKEILRYGYNNHIKPDSIGRTVLFNAKDPLVVDALLEAGADINVRDWQGNTPLLSQAGNYSHADAVAALLKHSPDVKVKNNFGETALHLAAKSFDDSTNGAQGILESLIALGADINAKDNQGSTPLDYASGYNWGNGKILSLLKKAGAVCANSGSKCKRADGTP